MMRENKCGARGLPSGERARLGFQCIDPLPRAAGRGMLLKLETPPRGASERRFSPSNFVCALYYARAGERIRGTGPRAPHAHVSRAQCSTRLQRILTREVHSRVVHCRPGPNASPARGQPRMRPRISGAPHASSQALNRVAAARVCCAASVAPGPYLSNWLAFELVIYSRGTVTRTLACDGTA
jgi:hypothetical protein